MFHCLVFKLYGEDNWAVFIDENHEEYSDAVEYLQNIRDEAITVYNINHFNEWVKNDFVKGIACHNLYGYDLPALSKIIGTEFDMFPEHINGSPTKIFDTLSISQGLYPDRPMPRGCPVKVKCPVSGKLKNVGPHGLMAWGYRVAHLIVTGKPPHPIVTGKRP